MWLLWLFGHRGHLVLRAADGGPGGGRSHGGDGARAETELRSAAAHAGRGGEAEQRAELLGLARRHVQATRVRGEASGIGGVAPRGGDAAVRGALAPSVLQPTGTR